MSILRNMRHARRYRQIIRIFLKHGLGHVLNRFGLGKMIPAGSFYSVRTCEIEPDSCVAEKLKDSLTELGPTFVKFGQLLSTRPDILPAEFIEQLETLQDKVAPYPFELVQAQILQELGDPQTVFAEIDPRPLAAASIGQVHRARLHSGEEVIIKVQRPNIEEQVYSDLEILQDIADLIEKHSPDAARVGLSDIVADYSKMFRESLDYSREAKNTERMYNNFLDDPQVVIPRLYWEYTTNRVLTEEYIEGIKLSDLATIEARGWDRGQLSMIGTRAFLTQVMVHGFFQADPHPGNMLILDQDRIAFIDFGETGSLTGSRLISVGLLLMGIDKHDPDQALSALYDMGIISDQMPLDDFEADFYDLVDRVYSSSMGSIDMNRLREDIMQLAFRYEIRLPKYLTALMKAMITVEGVGKKLDPTFNFSAAAKPVVDMVLKERLSVDEVKKMARRSFYRDVKPLLNMPRNVNSFFREAGSGRLKLSHELEVKEHTQVKFTQLANRVSASLIIAGGLVSISLLLLGADHPPEMLNTVVMSTAAGILLIGLYSFIISGRGK